MRQPVNSPQEERILVMAPTEADASLTRTLLAEAGLQCRTCSHVAELCHEIGAGAGALLLTEELLLLGEAELLAALLRQQQPWSDLPILMLTNRGADSLAAAWALDRLGNVTIMERPVRVTTLISGLRAALRARQRQYELRSRVEALHAQGEQLRLLWEAAAVLLTTDQPEPMLRGLFAKIAAHFNLDVYFNFAVDETGNALRLVSYIGIPDEEARKIARLEYGQAICGKVALLRESITATAIQQSDDPRTQLARGFGIRAYTCSPLIAGGRLLGTLSFASRSKDLFQPEELEFLQTVCHYVAYAYERLRLIRQLREEDEKKDEFLATLAHELRNPLAPIRNAVEYMRLKGSTDPSLQHARDIIDRQVRQMTRLVDDLLDISRITRGKIVLHCAMVDLGLVLSHAVESSNPVVEEAGHELTVTVPTEPLYVNGDIARLAQVFGNLLTNAAKYTDRGGRIQVVAERRGDEAVISVRDNGIGITAEYLPRLFDMFSQVAPALERSNGGLGIGLALVKSLVEMHAGRVEARSGGLGKGSEFIVHLPLLQTLSKELPAEKQDERHVAGAAERRCRVLVADDNIDSAESMADLLAIMGHEVRVAHDGLAALDIAEDFRPEVILLDIGMPKLNGYETARRIRQQPWGRGAVLVALTGWGQEDDRRRARDAGFDHHFTKPVDSRELMVIFVGSKSAHL